MFKRKEAKLLKLVIVAVELVIVCRLVFDLEEFEQAHVETVTQALNGCFGEVNGQSRAVVKVREDK